MGDSDAQPADSVDLDDFALILDVRPDGSTTVRFPRARWVAIADLLAEPSRVIPARDATVLVICDIGVRSALVAARLADAGYVGVQSMSGGIEAWRLAGRPLATEGFTPTEAERYDRQIKLREIGPEGQRNLLSATVTIVGVGGLGQPALVYLAASGVGRLTAIDPDVVELSNIHRQPLFGVDDVGRSKVDVVTAYVGALDPSISVAPVRRRLDEGNARSLLAGSDVVVDATDDFAARYAISDAAHELGIPVVTGAVYRWEGQLTVLPPEGPCYRCIFPDAPSGIDLDCAVTGVVGPVVATIGTMQATEAIKLLTGAGRTVGGSLIVYDGLNGSTTSVRVHRRDDCPSCGGQSA